MTGASGLLIRNAEPFDVARLAALQIESWRQGYGGIIADSTLKGLDFARFAIRWQRGLDEGMQALVAVAADEVVGDASAPTLPPTAIRGFVTLDDNEISMLYVAPDRWRQGVGRRLMLAALDRLRGEGHVEAWLWVLADNARGRAFYQSLGGRPEGQGQVKIAGQTLRQMRYVWHLAAQGDGGEREPKVVSQ